MKKDLRVDEIIVDPELQVRAQEPDHTDYEVDMRHKKGFGKYPPLEAVEVKKGEYYLVEGFTRLRAARAAGLRVVPCNVEKGKRKDAILRACGSNATHGFRRTPQDIRRAVLLAVEVLTDGGKKKVQPTQVANACNCSRTTVYRVLETKSQSDQQAADAARNGTVDESAVDPERNGHGNHSAPSSPKKKPAFTSEVTTPCPVCPPGSPPAWVATDGGYVCHECKHHLGAEAGGSGEEESPATNEDMQAALAQELLKCRSAYGALLRSLGRAGLLEGATEKNLLRVHAAIEKAIQVQNARG